MNNNKFTRREFVGLLAASAFIGKSVTGQGEKISPATTKIDRFALVSRHNPILRDFDLLSPLSVGNGEFAFTCDPTGLQTFADDYKEKMPLCTMSQWEWHTTPRPPEIRGKELRLTEYETYGRQVGYATGKTGQEPLFNWLRENPHRLHLGQIGFALMKSDATEAKIADISQIEQKLDLWTGQITSRFFFEGESVTVKTAAHPQFDLLAVEVESNSLSSGKIAVRLSFPYGSPAMNAADWSQPEKHETNVISQNKNSVRLHRRLDEDDYFVDIKWAAGAVLKAEKRHEWRLASKTEKLGFTVAFASDKTSRPIPDSAQTFAASAHHWKSFWMSGAAIEMHGSRDPRAQELERRVVLSQYLTAINCAGSMPPQETGLTTNSWYGKFHLEMHWWHAAHFALWNRLPLLEKSLDWYEKVLPSARARAQQQGYDGARWAKMTAANGRDSPSPIGPLLIWQQPHPIFYAELCYLSRPTNKTLQKFRQVVEETAKFMASYAHFDRQTNRYVLGPPVIPAQENHPARETWNPTFELEYWQFGLKTANAWRERMKLLREAKWDEIIAKLSPLPVKDGVYLAHENCPQTFTERNSDHPSMLGAFGILKGEKVDREIMRATLRKVFDVWKWEDTWGWDYPMTAMTAARLGESSDAIRALLLDTPKNHYAANGHNYQRPNLPLYLPGNGGLLYAIALMANGWSGAPAKAFPGFPDDGSWKIRAEGFDQSLFRNI